MNGPDDQGTPHPNPADREGPASGSDFRIRVNGVRILQSASGVSLLEALRAGGIFLPSACGGRGICGFCRCTIRSGAPENPTPSEIQRIKPEELSAGVRLACQIPVRRDLEIQISEALLEYRAFAAEVSELTSLTHDIKRIRLRLIQPKEIHFKAGQYVQIQSRPYPGMEESVWRSYSIASIPDDPGNLDLIIKRVPNGICTTWVHDHLKTRERVTLAGPIGDFFLREGKPEAVFVAGGSGMAPFASILGDMVAKGDRRNVTYFFGAVCRRDLYYLEEMNAFREKLPGFRFIPVVSQPEICDKWEGETGLVTVPLSEWLKSRGGTDGLEAYLCGSPGMIQACRMVLRDHGVAGNRVYFDSFS
ncbi:2Fe-2S iron-sulfur cluster binding domain-containing protein [bacterium]|nr:2Fe-2S iron-sulfur cluster binding domain-containing protein [bacterium]